MMRRTVRAARASGGGRPPVGPRALLGDDDEDVLERVILLGRLEDTYAVPRQPGLEPARGGLGVAVDDDVKAIAEERHAAGLHLGLQQGGGAVRPVAADLVYTSAVGGV